MASLSTAVERGVLALLAPLDATRGRLLRGLSAAARPAVAQVVARREVRVALAACLAVLVALALTLAAPIWLLALGPILLGVPHLLADVRYLVVRPGHHRRVALRWAVGVPLLVAGLGGGVLAGLTAAGGAAMVARTTPGRRCAALALIAALMGLCWVMDRAADLVLSHLHNGIALLLWWLWRPGGGPWRLVPAVAVLAGALALVAGLGDGAAILGGPTGLGAEVHFAALAPGLAHPWGLRLVLLFAFAQSIHYAVWLRLVPEDDRPRATPRTFAASWRALRADFGLWPLVATGAVALGLVAWAVLDLAAARDGYFRLALFHGHLELAALALVALEGRAALGGGRS